MEAWPYKDKSEGAAYLEEAVQHSSLSSKEDFLSDATEAWYRMKSRAPVTKRGKAALDYANRPREL